ncbi:MAG: SH3 domain-containing protein, partial [Acidobacteria bacterium]|nr:SH3 domain-containing protein [Acidobacteriota bacterium]
MRSKRVILWAFLMVFLVVGWQTPAQDKGVTSEPDVGLRAEQNSNAPVVANVKRGEPFSYECEAGAEWCKVTLRSEETGWLERGAIRQHFTEKDLPERDDPKNLSEIGWLARRHGFNYDTTVRAAARGDLKALKHFFALSKHVDGAAAESHSGVPTVVYHLLGDVKFAAFLKAQPLEYWTMVRNSIAGAENIPYLRRHFPETVKVLCRREIVEWPSPNGRYAIRKVFSDEFDLADSKVVRAELIEKETGQIRCDMTADDIGLGPDREGDVLWAPDSKRFAYLSAWMKEHSGPLLRNPPPAPQRKQTTVYQVAGESFVRIEMPLSEVPERVKDEELTGAVVGHEYTEPIRWPKPDVLILERHDYYQKLRSRTIE